MNEDNTRGSSVLKSQGFLPFYGTQLLGAFNDNLFKNALVILVSAKGLTFMGLSPAIVITIISGLFILPFFVFSAFAGQLADKYSKTRIIHIVKLAEVFIMLLGAAGFWMESLPILIAGVFLMGVHSTFFGPVKYSILPQILRDEELIQGNAWVETGTFLAILLGTILGGFLIILPQGWLLVAIASFVTSLLGWIISLRIPRLTPAEPGLPVSWNIMKPTFEVLRMTREKRSVFLSILGISWFWFFGAALLQLFPTYVNETLNGSEAIITLMLACFCTGIALGSILVEKISGRNLELALVPVGSMGMTLFTLDLAWMRLDGTGPLDLAAFFQTAQGLRIIFDLLGMSICGGFFTVPLYTLIQQRVEKARQSRVVGGNNILNSLFMAVASIMLAILLSLELTVPQIFGVLAILNAAVAIYIYRLLPEFLLRFLAWIISKLMYRRHVEGLSNIPDSGPCVLICNHISFVDWLIIAGSIRRPVRFVMDHRMASLPIVSFLTRQARIIPIAPQKESPEIKERAFVKIAEELRKGELICIFPEGAITWTGEMMPFKPGIERIIQETPVPVIPMALDGLWGSMFSRKGGAALRKLPRGFRARLSLRIGEPLAAAEVRLPLLEEMVRKLQKAEAQ
ncbi:MAG TPA: MFS transporter [Oligoflexus sp.]|uniref:MFS transporter n=1 Tax=Oligoflexus sp. TaxID=1971216 RepID=UPI002D48EE0A|nr:MFS transporter [Oligoflexus sp.]HYX36235.1 MFS transporter [Oligoflexus sp.]